MKNERKNIDEESFDVGGISLNKHGREQTYIQIQNLLIIILYSRMLFFFCISKNTLK